MNKLYTFLALVILTGSAGGVAAYAAEDNEDGLYDYTLTETETYGTDDVNEYDFSFEETIEKDGFFYALDYVGYESVNSYETLYADKTEPAAELVKRVTGITKEELTDYEPEKKEVKKYGFTYVCSDISLEESEDDTEDLYLMTYADTDAVNGEIDLSDYPQTMEYTYGDDTYKLPYSRLEKIEEDWYDGYIYTGRIEWYDAATYKLGDFEITKDELDMINLDEDGLNDVLEGLGYSNDLYRATSAHFIGEAYEDTDGHTYRDYCIEGEAYGARYRLYYEEMVTRPLYEATVTYTMSEGDALALEELKGSYEVTATAYYTLKAEESTDDKVLSTTQKIMIGAGVIIGIIIIAALIIYLVRGGRRPTDYKTRRDIKDDYKNL